jgi:REP element-mobilizing transposase RayT
MYMTDAEKKSKTYKPRKPLRLSSYYYGSSGAYAFTACTRKRLPYFEHPVLKQILHEEWVNLSQHFVGITPDVLVVMPEHIHGIIWIDATIEGSPTLDGVVGGYKSIASVAWIRYMNETGTRGSGRLWQRSFNDHIIRNDQDLEEKRNYALNNPIVADMKEEQRQEDQRKEERKKEEDA